MKPYYQEAGVTIYHGDCREILPLLDVEFILCDPPYGRAIEFGRRSERVTGDLTTELRDWIIAQAQPKLIFGSPLVSRPECRAVLIWDKSELTGMGDLGFPWKICHEEIYVIGEGFRAERRHGSVLRVPLRPAWTGHPDAVSGLHPSEKPVSLMTALLVCCPWKKVCDPTCGTGATLEAAKRMQRRATGIEIEERYCEIAANRLRQSVLGL